MLMKIEKDVVSAFSRKAYASMMKWKAELSGKTALLIEGARRVGKTFLIRRFVENEYTSFIFIDFSLRTKQVADAKRVFTEAENVDDIFTRLELIFAVKLIPGQSCIVFDEIQRFPIAREAIKSLVADGKYHFIESGSLVGIRENVKDIMIPSEEHKMKIHPLDFDEFLDAIGETVNKEYLHQCFSEGHYPTGDIHARLMRLFRLYMTVGGMPQSVAAYIAADDHKLEACDAAKRDILSLYDSDIGKYAKGYASKVRAIFRMIPGELAKREKKFVLSSLGENARMRRYENSFLWLSEAMVANIVYNSTDPDIALGMSLDRTSFKCYSLDTGLLVTQAMQGESETDSRLLRSILHDNLGVNEGMFFENVIAQTLAASGRDLFFYSRYDRRTPENTMEIDFLIRNGIKICPIESKAGNARSHASLDRFRKKYEKRLWLSYVVCDQEYCVDGGVTYFPAYAIHLLFDKNGK